MPKSINELRWTQGMKLINQIQSLSYYQVIKPFRRHQTRPIKPQLLQPPRPSDSSHLPNRPLDVEIGQVPSRRMPKADLAKMFDWQSHAKHKYGKPKAIHHPNLGLWHWVYHGIPLSGMIKHYHTWPPNGWWVGWFYYWVYHITWSTQSHQNTQRWFLNVYHWVFFSDAIWGYTSQAWMDK